MVGLPGVEKKIEDMYNHLDTTPACDGRTDRQTDRHLATAKSGLYAYASRGKNHKSMPA